MQSTQTTTSRGSARSSVGRACVIAMILVPALALGHEGDSHSVVGFAAGIAHPWSGLDHVAAFVLAGAWGMARGGYARWLAPPIVVALTVLGSSIVPASQTVPLIEALAALSVVALGALVLMGGRVTAALAGILLCAFALIHGQAHAVAVAGSTQPASFAAGLALSTLALQLLGMSIVATVRTRPTRSETRP